MLTPNSSPTASGSITALLERLKQGDHDAVALLWQRYYPRLVGLAQEAAIHVAPGRRRGGCRPQRLRQLLPPGRTGTIPRPEGPRRPVGAAGHPHGPQGGRSGQTPHTGEARGGNVRGDSALGPPGDGGAAGFDGLAGDEPTPEEAALLAEEVESLLSRLRDPGFARSRCGNWKASERRDRPEAGLLDTDHRTPSRPSFGGFETRMRVRGPVCRFPESGGEWRGTGDERRPRYWPSCPRKPCGGWRRRAAVLNRPGSRASGRARRNFSAGRKGGAAGRAARAAAAGRALPPPGRRGALPPRNTARASRTPQPC